MRLGELIDTLALMPAGVPVRFDFGAAPTKFVSWRGRYEELSLDWSGGNPATVARLLARARRADGGTFEGYKGGSYTMRRDTPVWADRWGESDGRMITGVMARPGCVEIATFVIPAEYR